MITTLHCRVRKTDESIKGYNIQQVGILSEHAVQLARLTEKRLGTSKLSNSIFERFRRVFDLVFSSNQVFINLLNY